MKAYDLLLTFSPSLSRILQVLWLLLTSALSSKASLPSVFFLDTRSCLRQMTKQISQGKTINFQSI